MKTFSLHPEIIHKFENGRFVAVSTNPAKNEIFEFDGPCCELLNLIAQKGKVSQADAINACQGFTREDVDSFLGFCLSKEILKEN
jgi:hypothetical protein